jgi:4a-hydroxytetrahydrobiopterin dehydratase
LAKRLDASEIAENLAQLEGWDGDADQIEKKFEFSTFAAALEFVNRVAALAEAAHHHPDIEIRYNKVRLALSTHSAGGVTGKDFALAAKIAALPGG